jgi:polar amino acid transport system substrate-binding protein
VRADTHRLQSSRLPLPSPRIRALAVALAAALAALAAGATAGAKPVLSFGYAVSSCQKAGLTTVNTGVLTVGTDNPAYPPWYAGGTPKGSQWKLNDPDTGKGFEPAVAYAVAAKLGYAHAQVKWVYVPFDRSFAPGPKSFDFDINQISYSAARAKVVSFSSSYYDVNQAIVVLKGKAIAKVHTVAGLKPYKLGAQLGTTSYGFISSTIDPSKTPGVFPTNAAAVQALKNGQIDGLVVDLPTAFYVTSAQVPGSEVLGQFPSPPGGEHFGMVFAKGNPLVGCANQALGSLRQSGKLKQIQQQWLAKATGAPVLK